MKKNVMQKMIIIGVVVAMVLAGCNQAGGHIIGTWVDQNNATWVFNKDGTYTAPASLFSNNPRNLRMIRYEVADNHIAISFAEDSWEGGTRVFQYEYSLSSDRKTMILKQNFNSYILTKQQGGGGIFAFIRSPTKTGPGDFETVIIDRDDAISAGLPDGGVGIAGYTGTAKKVVIPKTINKLPVVAIVDGAFREKELTSVKIPNSVTYIGNLAFVGNQLTSVKIPNSVIYIETFAFAHNQLTSVTIPNSVTEIGRGAFYENQLTSVIIPNSVTDLADNAFDDNVKITRQ